MPKKRSVKVLRVEREVTQTRLAGLIGITRNRLHRIETKQTPATPHEQQQLARTLKVNAKVLDVNVDARGATPGPRPRLAKAS